MAAPDPVALAVFTDQVKIAMTAAERAGLTLADLCAELRRIADEEEVG